jgi:hypothetical protein
MGNIWERVWMHKKNSNIRKEPTRKIYAWWEDNTKMDFKETGKKSVDWIWLAQDRDHSLDNMVMNFRVP